MACDDCQTINCRKWEALGMLASFPEESREKLNGPGFEGIGSENEGVFVADEDAFDYALEQCLHGSDSDQEEFKKILVDWYYSGCWLHRGV